MAMTRVSVCVMAMTRVSVCVMTMTRVSVCRVTDHGGCRKTGRGRGLGVVGVLRFLHEPAAGVRHRLRVRHLPEAVPGGVWRECRLHCLGHRAILLPHATGR